MTTPSARPKFVRWAVLLGIVVALNLFFFAGRALVIPEPAYDDYCPTRTVPASTSETCVAQDGVWIETTLDPAANVKTPSGYCDLYQKCQPLYEAAQKEYQLYGFVIMVGLGILALIIGVLPLGSSIVSSGLSYGGVLALVIAATTYWNDAATPLKLGISAIALIALLYIGAKRFKD